MKRVNRKSNPASRANKTRAARRTFRDMFGDTTYDVVSRIASGRTSDEIANELNLPTTSIAAYSANFTRGSYDQWVNVCNFRR